MNSHCKKFFPLALIIATIPVVCSANIVGYINVPIYPGDNLIANQLDNGSGNTLDTLFTNPAMPDGTTFKPWDPVANVFLPASTYDASVQLWDINYSLNLGQGAVIHSSSSWTETFVGQVHIYTNILGTSLGPGDNWNPNYASGLYLLSNPDPTSGPMSQMFPDITGRAPNDGEWVKLLNPATQTYLTTTYHSGTGWDNGDPTLAVGESAWVNLGPTIIVPEPSSLSLAGLVAGGLYCVKRRNFKNIRAVSNQ